MRIVALLLLCPIFIFGCSCVQVSQTAAFRNAKAVFDGEVKDVHYFDSPDKPGGGVRVLVTFDVSRQWKGAVRSTVQVHAWERALMCDSYLFKVGERYILYAVEQDKENGWADKYPSGTRILAIGDCILRVRTGDDLAGELDKLGHGNRPN